MSFMCNNERICPNLFELFLRSGMYPGYVQTSLLPAQFDAVDVARYVDPSGQAQDIGWNPERENHT